MHFGMAYFILVIKTKTKSINEECHSLLIKTTAKLISKSPEKWLAITKSANPFEI